MKRSRYKSGIWSHGLQYCVIMFVLNPIDDFSTRSIGLIETNWLLLTIHLVVYCKGINFIKTQKNLNFAEVQSKLPLES